jgi:hypothetical protein
MATKLLKANIRNFKPIKNFQAEVDGQNFWLIGENSTGKSSFQQLLKIAMGDANSIPQNMIADGHFWLDKDGQQYQSKVEAKNGKVSIKVTLPDGSVEDKKTVIRGLFGGVDFDIQEFVDWSKTAEGRRKQIKEFKSMLPQDCIDILNSIEKEIANRYDDRTALNQKVDSLKGYIKECKLYGEDLKIQPVDTDALSAELEKINAQNEKIRENNEKIKGAKQRFDDRAKKIKSNRDRIEELRLEMVELDRVTIIEENTQIEAAKWLEKHQVSENFVDATATMEAIKNASDTNVKASQAKEQLERMKKLEAFEAEVGNFTVEIELKREAIRDALREIDSPVAGLSYEGETLIYNGNVVDDKSLSTSEIIELGCKMAIAKNPDCGILFVSQGESIGNERLKLIQDLAKKNNWQIIAESVVRGKEKLEVELMVEN